MAWGSTAPAAITALVATLRAGMATSTTKVLDSAVVSDAGGQEVVNVGWQTVDQDSIEMTFDPYASAADLETVLINNAVRVQNARDAIAARARAFVLFNQVGSIIEADRTLGDAVMRAWISSGTYQADRGRGGTLATILFAVTYTAETTE